ncbi:GNAT family N-acetyltransferase [Clostridium sp. CM028]|uniref:GNAT family N-acetyltransferase n=1 Tax=unclassified Clostridium TaxID=2614128 RepID=UPI001C0C225A|nr:MULTISPECIES: GNAT family protein [unclassified Clostridium]MBU3093727.1 GNAT family N-acetyltransferase [Clostridium sp. CF011]MBW9147069.1 GNAT family N-acetyltransferase [Clostridium sp. CM027]MBW9150465.1 GNAT family N-acetyltransferase [Clostridium sp. CM028]UVE39986.1 GNAT family N-acetyltransferase [Clostridium sp. CM027]WAG68908.1 GNAT family N-acetyltransferase [Clostridium sp. CF011]
MLKGNKILLRCVERRDLNIFYDIWADEEVRRLDGNFRLPPSKEDILNNFNKFINLDKKYLSIINGKGVVVGYITFREISESKNVYVLGITVGQNFWNRGYGQDSVKVLLKYLFMDIAAHRVELEVLDFNLRAIQCYKKCGFIEEGKKRKTCFSYGNYRDVIIMGILREDFVNKSL